MATVSELRAAGTNLLLVPKELIEPLNPPQSFLDRLKRFGDNYDLSTSSHLFRFLAALCGEGGVGATKRELLYPKLQLTLAATHFTDLDKLYGEPLGLPRMPSEFYASDPKNEMMTQGQWMEVMSKDAAYRARCLLWMRAILAGPTKEGIKLAAEAACGFQCDVIERYQYLENLASDRPQLAINIGSTNSTNEFVIIPRTLAIGDADRRRIMRLVDKIRPVNTVFSVQLLDSPRIIHTLHNADASSKMFNIIRYVTGRPDVNWPPVDYSQALWIVGGQEVEAPQFAFFHRQEASTFVSIIDSTPSSEHVGPFNADQQALFQNLQSLDTTFIYDSSFSYAKAFAPLTLSSPWLRTADQSTTLINNYYPLSYFGANNIAQFPTDDPVLFWSSDEKLAPAADSIIYDLSFPRPVNFIDLEMTPKPFDLLFEYSNDGVVWTEFEFNPMFDTRAATHYIPSLDSPWVYLENHFTLTSCRFIRITFTRRPDPFPFLTSDPISYSVDMRNVHIANVVTSIDDFIADTGVDILGNSYRTNILIQDASQAVDGNPLTYWQSQPNPVADSVEAMYFDLRSSGIPGTMGVLDSAPEVTDFDNIGMADVENYFSGSVVVDEVYLDPITLGHTLHIYYSNDDEPHWDYKLWIPVPQTYTVRKGYIALPQPVLCKYIKLEFSRLTPFPYNALDYPEQTIIEYRKFPTWVQEYFHSLESASTTPTTFNTPFNRVVIDPLTFGFKTPVDLLHTEYDTIRVAHPTEATDEIKTFISKLTNTSQNTAQADAQATLENNIRFNSSFMYQQDLVAQLNDDRAISRYVKQNEGAITAETTTPTITPPTVQSGSDMSSAKAEKVTPNMYFPRKCRHEYQVLRSPMQNKVAYFVAIKDVSFHRRDYQSLYDENVIYESFDDQAHVQVNTFQQLDWRFTITP